MAVCRGIQHVQDQHLPRLEAGSTQVDGQGAAWEYGQSKIGVAFARLRTQEGQHLFTVKKPVAIEQACLEYESEVADRAQMHQAIMLMGFRPTVRIVKTRRTATVDGLGVCVDEVELAGVFMEIERTAGADQPGVVVQAEPDAWARSLGVERERTGDTYDSLVCSRVRKASRSADGVDAVITVTEWPNLKGR